MLQRHAARKKKKHPTCNRKKKVLHWLLKLEVEGLCRSLVKHPKSSTHGRDTRFSLLDLDHNPEHILVCPVLPLNPHHLPPFVDPNQWYSGLLRICYWPQVSVLQLYEGIYCTRKEIHILEFNTSKTTHKFQTWHLDRCLRLQPFTQMRWVFIHLVFKLQPILAQHVIVRDCHYLLFLSIRGLFICYVYFIILLSTASVFPGSVRLLNLYFYSLQQQLFEPQCWVNSKHLG